MCPGPTLQLLYDKTTGRLTTDGTWEYKPASVSDIPIDFRVSLLPNAPNPIGVLRSKATGEPPLTMACNVAFAIKNAVDAALAETVRGIGGGRCGDGDPRLSLQGQPYGFYPLNGPLTPEAIQRLCKLNITQFTLTA